MGNCSSEAKCAGGTAHAEDAPQNAELRNAVPLSGGAPVPGTKLFLRYDPSAPHAEWYRARLVEVEEWKADPANSAPGKDVMEAFLPWEQEGVEKARGSMAVPYHIDNLTEVILTEELRSGGALAAGAKVTRIVEKKALTDQGSPEDGRFGVLSTIFRVTVEYEPAGAGPPSMIYKAVPLAPDFYPLRGLCKGMRMWDAEVRAYNSGHRYTKHPAPRGYFAVYDPESYRYQLLLEDLKLRSPQLTPGDQVAGLRLNQLDAAVVAFEAAAALHAQYFDRTRTAGVAEFACTSFAEPFYPVVFPMMYSPTWAAFKEAAPKNGISLAADIVEWGDFIDQNVVTQMHMMAMSREQGDFMSTTLCHGDFRLDNLFFAYQPDGSVVRDAGGRPQWAVVDWQVVQITVPAFDLSYFVSQSVSPEFRRAHEKLLIEKYYLALVAGGVDPAYYPYEMLLYQYQYIQAFSWHYAVFGGNGALPNGERGVALAAALVDRWSDSYREWDVRRCFEWTIARFQKDPKRPLTVDECRDLLPERKRSWKSPVIELADVKPIA